MKALVVVDMQNDFVSGSLGSAQAQAVLARMEAKLAGFEGLLFATRDTHGADYLQTQEGRLLPVVHCVKGTPGWELAGRLQILLEAKGAEIFDKPAFGSLDLARRLAELAGQGKLDEVELAGLCTDICVVSNALLIKAFLPEIPLAVDASACGGTTPARHEEALNVMASCQIDVRR
ncbi:MAG: cysteine hydrolase [Mailhella sp.]|nr:cysteine hydrolase [Mailhella sp.]